MAYRLCSGPSAAEEVKSFVEDIGLFVSAGSEGVVRPEGPRVRSRSLYGRSQSHDGVAQISGNEYAREGEKERFVRARLDVIVSDTNNTIPLQPVGSVACLNQPWPNNSLLLTRSRTPSLAIAHKKRLPSRDVPDNAYHAV